MSKKFPCMAPIVSAYRPSHISASAVLFSFLPGRSNSWCLSQTPPQMMKPLENWGCALRTGMKECVEISRNMAMGSNSMGEMNR